MTGRTDTRSYRGLSALLLVLATVVVLVGWAGLHYVRRRLIASTAENVLLAAVDIAGSLDQTLYDRVLQVRMTAESTVIRRGSPQEITRYLSALRDLDPFYLWLGVTDASGEIVAATTPISVGVRWGERPWFRELRTADTGLRDAHTSIAIASPLRDEGGRFSGVLAAHIGLGALQRSWLRTVHAMRDRWGAWIDWQFLTPSGDIIDADLHRGRPAGLPDALLARLGAATGKTTGYIEETGTVTSYARTQSYLGYPGLGWTVIVRGDKSKILAPVDRAVRTLVVIGGLMVGPVFGLLLWSVRRLRVEWLDARAATTRARRAEAEQRGREEQVRAIVETASDAILTTDARGRIETANLACGRMFGYASGELARASLGMLVPGMGEEGSVGGGAMFPALRLGVGGGAEFAARHRDGGEFPVEIGVSPVPLAGRTVFTAIVRDVSARRLADTQAREHQATLAHALRVSSLGEMAAGLAHELHQPLTAIWSYAIAGSEEVRGGRDDSSHVVDILGRIEAEAQRAGAITRRLRDFVRKAAPRLEPTDLADRVRNVVALMGPELARQRMVVACDLGAGGTRVLGDPVQLEQVLVNIVQNAVDAIREARCPRGRIRIGVAALSGGSVEVSVRDNGGGIPDGVADRMFDAFFTTKPQGLGMGLAISRAIIAAHGGRLWAEPDPGGGTIVRFVLSAERETDAV
jgi:two-component system sensor kinase FixL